jgi:hypothetical protein
MMGLMPPIRVWRRLVTAIILGNATVGALAQTELKPIQQTHLPVSSSRGSYNHFPYSGMDSREHFSFRVTPDQSLLVLDADAGGQWPLVRLRKWWTDSPVNEVLSIPGLSSADAKYLNSINVDLQITPDGRYAIAFAGAYWMDKSVFLLHAPKGYIPRKADTIITVIDLENWKIVGSLHTAGMTDGSLKGVRVVNDKWIALDFIIGPAPVKNLLYRYDSRLISVPDLHSGPQCVSDRPFLGPPSLSLGEPEAAQARERNDSACLNVLQATGAASVQAFEIFIYRGQDVLPAAVQQKSHDLLDTESEFFRGWGEYPYYLLYSENPPFESSSHAWYGLYNSIDRPFYDLVAFDPDGRKQKSQTVRSLLCGDPSLEQRGSACGCRVIDASERDHDLIAYCRTQRGDFDGTVRREWLAPLHLDDASGDGFISLTNKDRQTLAHVAVGDGRPYVVTLESGEILRVYSIPDRR